MTEPVGREWKVRLDVDLTPEVHDRVTRAIQKATLAELADIDVANAFSINLRGPGERGRGPIREGEEDPFGPDRGGDHGQTDGLVAKDPTKVLGQNL
jgi:hypothetical protein